LSWTFTNKRVLPDNYISSNPEFCRSALARYSPADFVAMVERHGVAYRERSHGRLFCHRTSRDILRMLTNECLDAGVRFELGCEVRDVHAADGFDVRTSRETLRSACRIRTSAQAGSVTRWLRGSALP
jgi:predicted flavoprotein YhiN